MFFRNQSVFGYYTYIIHIIKINIIIWNYSKKNLKLHQKSYCSSPNTGSNVFIRGDHCEDRIRIYTLKYWWWHHLLKENWTLKSSLSSLKEHLKEQSKLSFSFWFLASFLRYFSFFDMQITHTTHITHTHSPICHST